LQPTELHEASLGCAFFRTNTADKLISTSDLSDRG
jgi:hypothetical protein